MGHNLVQRIELLQRVRNAALEPLWDDNIDLWSYEEEPVKNPHLRKKHARGIRRLARLPPTHILFTNDVYACARDNIRLLYHDADLACGTDWWVNDGLMTFYDIWVARDIIGRFLPFHHCKEFLLLCAHHCPVTWLDRRLHLPNQRKTPPSPKPVLQLRENLSRLRGDF